MAQMAGQHHQEYTKLVDILGAHFQIRDDLLNLTSDKYKDEKGYCEDLTEGKYSFPLVYCIQNKPDVQLELDSIFC
jgi:geranylgeranyl diphosphate synthase type 3